MVGLLSASAGVKVALSILVALPLTVLAQEQPVFTLDDLAPAIEEWARENIDEDVLKAFGGADRKRLQSLFDEINRRFQGNSVYDVGALKDTASALLPVLESVDDMKPYATWLRTHLDYFVVSDELQHKQPSQPNPGPEAQRNAWDRQLEKRPSPARANVYVPKLKPIFAAHGAPPALVWLGEVESSFDPAARSPAGAVGMFQFMSATAKAQGLSVSPRDERLDPEKSARAAAKYLRYLHGRFGDWRLALAAYNAGETRVNNLLARYKTRSYSSIATRLPAETQLYVPKIEATVRKREGLSLSALALPKTD